MPSQVPATLPAELHTRSPREAVKQLIATLREDELTRTSDREAGELAYVALVHFHVYYNTLPNDSAAKNSLSVLVNILQEMYQIYDLGGPCIDIFNRKAMQFLETTSHDAAFDINIPLSDESLSLLKIQRTHRFFASPQPDSNPTTTHQPRPSK